MERPITTPDRDLPSTSRDQPSSHDLHWETIHTCFNNRIGVGRVVNTYNQILPDQFLKDSFGIFQTKIQECLRDHIVLKVNAELACDLVFVIAESEHVETFHLITKMKAIYQSTNIEEWFTTHVIDALLSKLDKLVTEGSGKSLSKLHYVQFNFATFDPLHSGSSYIPFPPALKFRRGVLNIRNEDQYCFLWCLTAFRFPALRNRTVVSSYRSAFGHLRETLDLTNTIFPMDIHAIGVFERDNPDYSFTVFGVRGDNIVGPLHVSSTRKAFHIKLLYIENETTSHYCLIEDLAKLVGGQLSTHHSRKYICENCLQYFQTSDRLQTHEQDCLSNAPVKIILPEGDEAKLKFTNLAKQQLTPFIVYSDIECLTTPIQTCQPDNSRSYTNAIQKHTPFAVAYNVVCAYDETLSFFRTFRGENCIGWFLSEMQQLAIQYDTLLQNPKPMQCTPENIYHFNRATNCHICQTAFTPSDVKVYDHCHFLGCYRGAAHQNCNLQYQAPNFIPIVFHNLSGYDSHFLIREFANLNENTQFSILPNNHERFISFSVRVTKKVWLRFLDSYKFLSTSLDALVKGLSSDELRYTRKNVATQNQFSLCVRKGVFPYDYCNSWDVLNDTQLPPKEAFYSVLNQRVVSNSEYAFAQSVWNTFHIQTLGEYADLYLKIDVLLLSDVFEKFRNMCQTEYGLDPAQYYTSPGVAFDAMLKYTKVELELLTDIDMLLFFERGVRGGFVSLINRHAKANNEYMREYDPDKPSSYLMYFDVNNLYGYAMSQKLPQKDFRWLDETSIHNFNVQEAVQDCERGYVLEVDLSYPRELHREHSDLPFCVERIVPPESNAKHMKLVGTLLPKKRYVLHIDMLNQCISHGLVLEKIHRGISFIQSAWLAPFMTLNTELRQRATQEFDSNLFKLMNNCIYGKSLENVRKYRDIHLVNTWEGRYGASAYIARPNFKTFKVIVDDLITVELKKTEIKFRKPIYLGMTILDIAKLQIYKFHYEFAKQKFGKVSLLYSDTDSLIYQIETCDAYRVMRENATQFDTSAFPNDNPFQIIPQNKRCLGLMKDECAGNPMTEYVGLASKLYAFRTQNLSEVTKAKGVRTSDSNSLRLDTYLNVLNTVSQLYNKQFRIVSKAHEVFLVEQLKRSLAVSDDKREWSHDLLTSVPWGFNPS